MTTEAIQEQVNDARQAGTPLRIVGRSHWLDAGRPVAASRTLSVASHSGVVDYVPGDLTITVRSGTTLREISEVTAHEGQWFPLDPFGSDEGTIGATIATGSSGPLAQRFGGVRDLVLGVEFVAGDGKVVRGGGRVVKNVAGFDLTRLLTGSWGTLGVITEATLRLYSAESPPATMILRLPNDAAQVGKSINAVRTAPVAPFSTQLVDQAVASMLGLSARTSLLIVVGGNADSVASQKDALSSLGAEELDARPWGALRVLNEQRSTTFRVSSLAGRVAEMWQAVGSALERAEGVLVQANVGLGVVRCIVPEGADATLLAGIPALSAKFSVVFEKLPPSLWQTLSPSVTADRLSRGIKQAFDPANVLNPGILGD